MAIENRGIVAGSSRCDERSAQRTAPNGGSSASQSVRSGLRALPLRLCVSALLLIALGAFAQYAINWSSVDGGGGTSTNGQYSVSGTIGQPDAGGPMTNGQYSLTGGFWALPQAVQTEGAPTLTIVAAGPGLAQMSWVPATGTNWVLQESTTLSPASWINSASGATNSIVVPATVPTKFYRLFKP